MSNEAGAKNHGARLAVLPQLSRSIGASLDAQRTVSIAAGVLVPHVDATSVQLWRVDGHELALEAAEPVVPDHLAGFRLRIGETLVGLAATRRVGVRSDDVVADDRVGEEFRAVAAQTLTRSVLAIPLLASNELVGVLAITHRETDRFDDDDLAFGEAVGVIVGNAIEGGRRFTQVMELERLKADFISRISHELRTPITIMNGFLDTLIAHDDSIDRAARIHMLERSQAASHRLADLIGDLLMLSKVETGMLRPAARRFDLADLLHEVIDRHEVSVTATFGSDLLLEADPALVERALAPVIDNAVKYGQDIEVCVERSDAMWLVRVSDDGPGIAPDVRDVAFEVFTRSSTTTNVPGLGLGLAVARTVVEAIGGSIDLRTKPNGTGTEVELRLPGAA